MTADTIQPKGVLSSPITVLNFAANAIGCKALSAAYKHANDPLQHCGAYNSAALYSLGQCPHRSTLNSYCILLLSHSQHLQEKIWNKIKKKKNKKKKKRLTDSVAL